MVNGSEITFTTTLNLSDFPQPASLKPTPDMGEHTDQVLAGLGYDKPAIEKLRAGGVI